MSPDELTDDEALALICLARALAAADGVVSDEETKEIGEIGLDLGEGRYDALSTKADGEPTGLDHALSLADSVERPRARDLMLTMLGDLANSDGIADEEKAIIDALKGRWS